MLGVYTIVEASRYGWGSAHTIGLGAAALALLGAFLAREARAENPLVPLRVFRVRNSAGANLIVSLMVAGLFGMFFLGAIYMQKVLGYDALEVGLAFLPVAVLIGALSLGLSAQLNTRYGARATLLPGLGLVVAGLLWFARSPTDATYVTDLLPVMIVFGVGAGPLLPVADDARDVERHPERVRPCLRARQHDDPGRRRAWARGRGDAVVDADEGPSRRRAPDGLGADKRLPSRLPRRCGPRRRRDGGRRDRARACPGAERRRERSGASAPAARARIRDGLSAVASSDRADLRAESGALPCVYIRAALV